MKHNQFETKNSDSRKASTPIELYGGQQDDIAMDEDGSNTGGDLNILFTQDLSDSTLVDLNGGQRNAPGDISNGSVDDGKGDKVEVDGGCGGDIILWDVVG